MLVDEKKALVLKIRIALTRAVNNCAADSSTKQALGVLIFEKTPRVFKRSPLMSRIASQAEREAIEDLLELLDATLQVKCPAEPGTVQIHSC
jgi:hypothetical protein